MLALALLGPVFYPADFHARWSMAAIDAGMLVLICSPIIYFWVIRPYVLARLNAEAETRQSEQALKERVADLDELGGAIRRVAAGGSVIDPKVVEALIDARSKQQPSLLDRLSEREMEVLAEMATGASNAAIAEALFISARSVEKHINSIFTKLGLSPADDAHRRVRAVLVYLGSRA